MADMDARVARILSSPACRRWYESVWKTICLEAEEVGWVQPGRRGEVRTDVGSRRTGQGQDQTTFTQQELEAAVREKWPKLPDELVS